MRKLTIKGRVGVNDIKGGKAFSMSDCPIARSLKRCAKAKYVKVRHGKIGFRLGKTRYVVKMPRALRGFAARFDANYYVAPKRFQLTIPTSMN